MKNRFDRYFYPGSLNYRLQEEYSTDAVIPEPIHAVGETHQGGVIAYLLQPVDNGYDANKQHGIIAAPADQNNAELIAGAAFQPTGVGVPPRLMQGPPLSFTFWTAHPLTKRKQINNKVRAVRSFESSTATALNYSIWPVFPPLPGAGLDSPYPTSPLHLHYSMPGNHLLHPVRR
jgi:hypothetical protein